MTARWTEFVAERKARWEAGRSRNVRVHGEQTVASLDLFYGATDALFQGGHLGGVRILCRRA